MARDPLRASLNPASKRDLKGATYALGLMREMGSGRYLEQGIKTLAEAQREGAAIYERLVREGKMPPHGFLEIEARDASDSLIETWAYLKRQWVQDPYPKHFAAAGVWAYGKPVRNPPLLTGASVVTDQWQQRKVDRGWPETWEAKLGADYYTVAGKGVSWKWTSSHRPNDPDGIGSGARYASRELAMKAAEEYATYANRGYHGNPAKPAPPFAVGDQVRADYRIHPFLADDLLVVRELSNVGTARRPSWRVLVEAVADASRRGWHNAEVLMTARANPPRGDEANEVITEGAARTLWLLVYMDYIEGGGEGDRPSAGEDWDDIAPDAPEAAESAAKVILDAYVDRNGVPLADLVARAAVADGLSVRRLEPEFYSDFGSALIHMALGTGVSWFDDHKPFELARVRAEANYDGEKIWVDHERARLNPAGLTAKGERMYGDIKRSYQQRHDPRAKEIAARTVYARARGGAPGLRRR